MKGIGFVTQRLGDHSGYFGDWWKITIYHPPDLEEQSLTLPGSRVFYKDQCPGPTG